MSYGSNAYRRLMLSAASSAPVRGFMLRRGRRLALRFVASETREALWPRIRELDHQGILAAIDHLGETIVHIEDAPPCREEYVQLSKEMDIEGIPSHLSMKPTQLGLLLDPEACYHHILAVVKQAAASQQFVCLDMENSLVTDATLSIVRKLHNDGFRNVGTVIQAYLHRSREDVEQCLRDGISLRLVKGAYNEPAAIAYQSQSAILKNFNALIRMHLEQGAYVAVATHDDAVIRSVKQYATEHDINKSAFEFQMLYGLRMKEQQKLAEEGYRIRCYVPYGTMWYPYYTRRLAEKPSHLWLVIKNMLG
ncbi:proline dehydrogenase family protein [Paenibacillus sp. HB172176]|uniref:proline dehydrogenase family protein n=1 Tax=Paenibacillus sp. HB172176 TaxID=2493690 RepID=UPI00143BA819|nr:proline dehydrogenase family protein [Paenibacillus sp. HB172176]